MRAARLRRFQARQVEIGLEMALEMALEMMLELTASGCSR